MPGIVGYVGPRDAGAVVLAGLHQLEYRDYDSAGIGVIGEDGTLVVERGAGKRLALDRLAGALPLGHVGVGHTRWATHGRPSERNAHPHTDCTGRIALVHGGIIPGFQVIRDRLIAAGHRFRSDTDTEILPHLIEERLAAGAPDVLTALRIVLDALLGAQTVALIAADDPDALLLARSGGETELVIGYGDGEMFVASEKPALVQQTRRLVTLEPVELARVTADGASYFDFGGHPLTKRAYTMTSDPVAAALGGYHHFTQKEIYEQPEAINHTIRGRMDATTGGIYLDEVRYTPAEMRALTRMVIVGAGSSWYSAMAGKWIFEELTGLPVEVESAGEFRYRNPPFNENSLLLAISQSGGSGDTLAAMEMARAKGSKVLLVTNGLDTPAEAFADGVVCTYAGPELGVAATKSFICSIAAQALLGLGIGWARGTVERPRAQALTQALAALPRQLATLLGDDEVYNEAARAYAEVPALFFVGRGPGYAAAMQGAHLIQVMAQMPARGVPGGEVQHGTRVLLNSNRPVVAVAPQGPLYAPMIRVIEQLHAQGVPLLAVGPSDDRHLAELAEVVLPVPPTDPLLTPVLATVPLQLLAYEIAVRRGCDVDHPPHLAKTVSEG